MGIMNGIHNALSIFAKGYPGVRQANLLAIANEELDTEGFFQRFNLEGDGGLAHV
jgi:hypothetical protein